MYQQQLLVTEIFHSIQGESTYAGRPCIFIRLARCNLRCTWCDTTYSFTGGESLSIDQICSTIAKYPCQLVEITGGEPLAQEHCSTLAKRLIDKGYKILVETNGSLPIDGLPEPVVRIMDIKCPDSGESDKNYWPNIALLRPDRDEVKFVLAGRKDYEWSRDLIRQYNLDQQCAAILMAPVWGRLPFDRLAAWILEDGLPVRHQVQLHKIIWAPDQRGV